MTTLNERVDAIVDAMLEAACDACTSDGAEAAMELTMAAMTVTVRLAISGTGGPEQAKIVIANLSNDYFSQAVAQMSAPKVN